MCKRLKRVSHHPKGQKRTSVSNRLESACQRPKVYNKAANIQKVTKSLLVSKSFEKSSQYSKTLKGQANMSKVTKIKIVSKRLERASQYPRVQKGPTSIQRVKEMFVYHSKSGNMQTVSNNGFIMQKLCSMLRVWISQQKLFLNDFLYISIEKFTMTS